MWEMVAATVGSQLIGGAMQGDAAKDAANSQANATANATAETRRQFDMSREDLAPWRKAGSSALNNLEGGLGLNGKAAELNERIAALAKHRERDQDAEYVALMRERDALVEGDREGLSRKFTMEDYQNDPVMKASFDFGASEGEKAVRRMFGSKGLARSGGAVKAITRFATDYGGQQAGSSRQRFVEDQNNLFAKLSSVAGNGQAATTATAGLGASTANNIGNMIVGEGNARGAAAIAGSNAMGGAIANIGNTITSQHTLNRLFPTQTPQAPLAQGSVPGQFNLDSYG